MALSGREKATIFLSILGADASAQILRHLPEEIADLIASGVNQLPSPSPESLSAVLDEFRSYMTLPPSQERRTLTEGARRAPARGETGPADVIQKAPVEVLAGLLSGERPEVIGFIAAQMESERAQLFLGSFGNERAAIEEVMGKIKSHHMTSQVRDQLYQLIAKRLVAQHSNS